MRNRTPYLLLTPLTVYFLTFLAAPLAIVFAYSLSTAGPDGTVRPLYTLANYAATLDPRYLDVLGRSVAYATASTLLCLALAYPLAFWIAMHGGTRKNTWLLLVMLPFWTSFLIRVYSWKAILATRGILNMALLAAHLIRAPLQILNTPAAVVLGLVYGFLPFMTLPIYVSLEKLDRALLEAASDLGATPLSSFLRVVLPLSLPGVLAGSILTFVPAVGDFVTPDLLGGPENQMIGNIIESKFFPEQNWPAGAAVACGLMAALLLAIWTYTRLVRAEDL